MESQSESTQKESKKTSRWRRFLAWVRRWRLTIEIILGAFVLLFLYFWPNIVISVHSGEMSVLYRRFFGGTYTERPFGEGVHLIFPWDKMYIYDVRVQQKEHTFPVLTLDGLLIEVTISIRYRPQKESLGVLHKEIGPEYLDKVVIPEIQSALRVIIGQMHPDEIFTTQRDILQLLIMESRKQISERYIILDDLLIKKVLLPEKLRDSIERKLRQQQQALEYEYRLLEAEQEAKRKKIEAQGIRDFQDIVSEGISRQLLQWRGIEATLKLAESPNSKIIIIGGSDGLPLILNTGDSQPSSYPESATYEIPNATDLIPSMEEKFYSPFSTPGGQQ